MAIRQISRGRYPGHDALFCECGGVINLRSDGSGYCQSCEEDFTAAELKCPAVQEVAYG